MTLAATTELVEISDPAASRAWRTYHESGMPELIGAHHLCHALDAFARTGMAARLAGGRAVTEEEAIGDLDPHLAGNLLRYLGIRGVVRADDEGVALTSRGEALLSEVSVAQLGFYLEAYGPVTQHIPDMLGGRMTYGVDVERNGEALGRHCATLFRTFHTAVVLKALEGSDARHMLDLGCGGGQLLVDACIRDPGLRGVGLDISPGAIEFARELAEREGVADRVSFVVGDAFAPETWPAECHEADSLCAVGVVHEHFRAGEQAVLDILETYAGLLRGGMKTFILGEPEIRFDDEENDADLYLVHIFTAQGFPREHRRWLELLERSSVRCRRLLYRPDAGPRFGFYDLVPR
jgi:SAM-dependent methyltransferase